MARALAWHARGHRFDPDILHVLREKATVNSEQFATAVVSGLELRKQIFHFSLFTFTLIEIFDILTQARL